MNRFSHAIFLLMIMIFSFSFVRFEIFYFLPNLDVSWTAYWLCGFLFYIALLNLRETEGLSKIRDAAPNFIVAMICVAMTLLIGDVFLYNHVEGVIPTPEILGVSIAYTAFIFNIITIIIIFLMLTTVTFAQKIIRKFF